jgi:hypothetical protein
MGIYALEPVGVVIRRNSLVPYIWDMNTPMRYVAVGAFSGRLRKMWSFVVRIFSEQV